MHHGSSKISSIYKATYGIIFFGTPHRGLAVDDIRPMLGDDKHPRQSLLRQISSTSDLLMNQLGDFKDIIHDRKIVSFYENLQTRKPEFVWHTSIKMFRKSDNALYRTTRINDGGEQVNLLPRSAQTLPYFNFPLRWKIRSLSMQIIHHFANLIIRMRRATA